MDTAMVDPLSRYLASIAMGDQFAMGMFYRETHAQVSSTARTILANKEDVEELANDVYLLIWRHAATYQQSRGSVRGWLASITRYRAIDKLRRRRATISIDDAKVRDFSPAGLVDSGLTGFNRVAQIQYEFAARNALLSIDPMRRRLLELSFFQELSHRDIAAVMGLPIGTVKSHLRRALRSMRPHCAR
ncbi:MAG: sigma-70 family RNA polymerase sigma factor [Beijerinckiaceae bacterium]